MPLEDYATPNRGFAVSLYKQEFIMILHLAVNSRQKKKRLNRLLWIGACELETIHGWKLKNI